MTKIKMTKIKNLIDINELCEILCIKPSTVYSHIRGGALPPPVKIGQLSYWPMAEIERYHAAILAGCTRRELQQLTQDLLTARAEKRAALKADDCLS